MAKNSFFVDITCDFPENQVRQILFNALKSTAEFYQSVGIALAINYGTVLEADFTVKTEVVLPVVSENKATVNETGEV